MTLFKRNVDEFYCTNCRKSMMGLDGFCTNCGYCSKLTGEAKSKYVESEDDDEDTSLVELRFD